MRTTKKTTKALEAFEASLAEQTSELTRRGYLADVRAFFVWYAEREGRRSPVTGVRADDIRSYRTHLLKARGQRTSAVRRKLFALKRFYRSTVAEGFRGDNPAMDAVKGLRRPRSEGPVGLTKDEEQSLLRAAGQTARGLGPRNYALVQLMLQTGVSVDEVAELLRGDVTLEARNGTAKVRGGSSPRTVTLSTPARRGLRRYLDDDDGGRSRS